MGSAVPRPVGRIARQHGPIFLSHMFNGGLLIGVSAQGGSPARILAGVDLGSAGMECVEFCRDLGFDGVVTFNPTGASGERKHVTWRYTDAGSVEAVGLEVVQQSFDGIRPHDYVLFHFRIRNTSPSTLRLHAGFFGDWDIQPDAFDDRGATAMGGRLMYQVSETGSRIHVGTLLLGEAPVTGNYFFGFRAAPASVNHRSNSRIARGTSGRPRPVPPTCATSRGPDPSSWIRGRPRMSGWVVAGESRSQLIANANAARDHVSRMVNTAISDDDETMRIAAVRNRTLHPWCTVRVARISVEIADPSHER